MWAEARGNIGAGLPTTRRKKFWLVGLVSLVAFLFFFFLIGRGLLFFKGPGRAACLKKRSGMGGLHWRGLAGGGG